MIRTLLSHEWKSFWRSRSAGKGLALRIFMGFIIIYLMAVATGLGFLLKEIIQKYFPGQDLVEVFCGFILYYFLLDMLMRFMLQELPTLIILPYLAQNIKRSELIRFLNVRSAFSVFNLLPLLLFTPFTLVVISARQGGLSAILFLLGIFLLTLFNHFLILFIKRRMVVNGWWMIGFLVILAAIGLSDYYHIFSLSHISSIALLAMVRQPWLVIVPMALAGWAFVNNYRFLFKSLYFDDMGAKTKRRQGADYAFLDRFGTIGELISLDVKLIIRNKRPRSLLLLSLVFLFYGFIFYKPEFILTNQWGMMILGAIFITGLFITNYGQLLFAWQSSHFDGLMTSNLQVHSYIKAKFILLISFTTLAFLISSLYGFMSWKLILVQLAAYLYNIGVSTLLVGYFATRSYKGIDISRGASFNYQGMGASQYIYTLFVLLIPSTIYWSFNLLFGGWAGVAAIGVAGLTCFLLQDWWIGLLTKEFFKRKYLILQGFREK